MKQFKYAIYNNSLDVVKDLIENNKIDPRFNDNYAFRHACKNGHVDMVKYLISLKSHQINISDNDNYALKHAIMKNHTDVIDILFNHVDDGRLKIDYDILEWTVKMNNHKYFIKIFKEIKKNIYMYTSRIHNIFGFICRSSNNIDINIINDILLDLDLIGIVSKDYYYYFSSACYSGNVTVVAALLKDGRFDPSDKNNTAINYCSKSLKMQTQTVNKLKYKIIANMIMSDPRFVSNNLSENSLEIMMEIRNDKMERLLKNL